MKIAALIMFKNEQFNLPNCLRSISGVVEFILGYDDFSSDDSAAVFESMGGILVGRNSGLRHVNGQEKEIRSMLFDEARKLGATHYLCIDADEFFSDILSENFRMLCEKLNPGQKLLISWVNLADDGTTYYPDESPFQPTLKDFAVKECSDLAYSTGQWLMHFDRTPSPSKALDPEITPSSMGAVMHMQHLNKPLYELKQAKYKCLELVKTGESAFQINENANFTLLAFDNYQGLPIEYIFTEFVLVPNDFAINETLAEIFLLFDQYGVLFFEKLEIWQVDSLRQYFTQQAGRSPRHFYFSKFLRKVKLKCLVVFKTRVIKI